MNPSGTNDGTYSKDTDVGTYPIDADGINPSGAGVVATYPSGADVAEGMYPGDIGGAGGAIIYGVGGIYVDYTVMDTLVATLFFRWVLHKYYESGNHC